MLPLPPPGLSRSSPRPRSPTPTRPAGVLKSVPMLPSAPVTRPSVSTVASAVSRMLTVPICTRASSVGVSDMPATAPPMSPPDSAAAPMARSTCSGASAARRTLPSEAPSHHSTVIQTSLVSMSTSTSGERRRRLPVSVVTHWRRRTR